MRAVPSIPNGNSGHGSESGGPPRCDNTGDEVSNADCAEDPAPVCVRCGSEIGIFIKFGLRWRHYRGGEALGQAEIFDPGHEPELAWRLPGPTPTRM